VFKAGHALELQLHLTLFGTLSDKTQKPGCQMPYQDQYF